MGKKRKVGGPSFAKTNNGIELEDNSKLRIDTYDDVADSEDDFHINRDKILFEEGPAQKRQRKAREQDEFLEPSDEEVLAVSEDLSSSEEGVEDGLEDDEDVGDLSDDRPERTEARQIPEESDSEASTAPEEDFDADGWGTSRKDYYNADAIETEADALEEEAEAWRLQQKQLQGMTAADFGLDEVDWPDDEKLNESAENRDHKRIVQEVLPRVQITDDMGPDERTKIFKTRYPEFEHIAKEFLDLQAVYEELKIAAAQMTGTNDYTQIRADDGRDFEENTTSLALIKHTILAAYLASISMYFALLSSGGKESDGKQIAMPPEELRYHAVMSTLVRSRNLWEKVKDIALSEPSVFDNDDNHKDGKQADAQKVNGDYEKLPNGQKKPEKRKHRKSKMQKAAEVAEAKAQFDRAEKLRKTEEGLADLSALLAPSKLQTKAKTPLTDPTKIPGNDDSSDFGEATTLTAQETAEKASRKKSLRFYTSQIAQKANKRGAAGRDAGGDADIPYRERLKDRQARLNVEAEKRGKKPGALGKRNDLGGASDEEDYAAARELRNEGDSGSEDFYDLVAKGSAARKAAKMAARAGVAGENPNAGRIVDDGMVGEDGKRGISYQIEKNKGITPKRKKDVRNPRVKKRKKFEDKKKKLGSVRPVYKGGEGRGGYGGELTGIKKNLVKSRKL